MEDALSPLGLPLDGIPVAAHVFGRLGRGLAEDVGMPAHQLVVDAVRHVAQIVEALLLGHGGDEVHLEEEVAQLPAHGRSPSAPRPPRSRTASTSS